MLNRERNAIITSRIVNLTGKPFVMYEESTGDILVLLPNRKKLPAKVDLSDTFYVVEKEQIEKLREEGRDLDDITFICNEDEGYAKIHFCALASAKNPSVQIGLQRRRTKPHQLPYLDDSLLYVEI